MPVKVMHATDTHLCKPLNRHLVDIVHEMAKITVLRKPDKPLVALSVQRLKVVEPAVAHIPA
jgi:hypothetical protein